MQALVEQILRFGAVGLLAAVGHYGTLIGLVELADARKVLAAFAGNVVGGVIAYLLNYHWTFVSDALHRVAVAKFLAVTLAGIAINLAVFTLLVDVGQLHYILAQLIATGVVMFWSFWANKLWTFGATAGARR